MAIDRPCSFGCGRWGRLTSDICEVCASNKSVHKRHRPAQRMKYRQRLALATLRQTTYAEEFGDPKHVEEIEMIEPKGKGTGRRRAEVIDISSRRRTTKRKKRA